MTVKEILAQCAHLQMENANDISDDFAERTCFAKDFQQLEATLNGIFGPPVKKAGEEVAPDMLILSIDYGGLQEDQILYYKQFDDCCVIAMLWPWKDNHQMTLKIASFKK